MTLGIIGQKIGMSQVLTEDGGSVPVTVIHVESNKVSQIKTESTDGYTAVQVAYGSKKVGNANSAEKGHFAKANIDPSKGLHEFRLNDESIASLELGADINVSIFTEGDYVDVTGTSIGKGFAGAMKRHGFKGGRATHGNSKAHRKPGSIGQNQDPGRVFPGKKMAGHMGDAQRTQQNLQLVQIDEERQLLFVRGSVPGSKGQSVVVKPAVKKN